MAPFGTLGGERRDNKIRNVIIGERYDFSDHELPSIPMLILASQRRFGDTGRAAAKPPTVRNGDPP